MIQTALTLEAPVAGSELERRFLDPLMESFFAGYPDLRYAQAHARRWPAGQHQRCRSSSSPPASGWTISPLSRTISQSNYTHVLDTLLRSGFNVLAQLIAPPERDGKMASASAATPTSASTCSVPGKMARSTFLTVGQVNDHLPYMRGDAERPAEDFDFCSKVSKAGFPLFNLPHQPVSLADHAIGLRVARLIPDGGTMQVGIGSIGDAICNALLLRHQENHYYQQLLDALGTAQSCCHPAVSLLPRALLVSEMLVEGFLDLLKAGILKREVDGMVLHAGFFVGSPLFYTSCESCLATFATRSP